MLKFFANVVFLTKVYTSAIVPRLLNKNFSCLMGITTTTTGHCSLHAIGQGGGLNRQCVVTLPPPPL